MSMGAPGESGSSRGADSSIEGVASDPLAPRRGKVGSKLGLLDWRSPNHETTRNRDLDRDLDRDQDGPGLIGFKRARMTALIWLQEASNAQRGASWRRGSLEQGSDDDCCSLALWGCLRVSALCHRQGCHGATTLAALCLALPPPRSQSGAGQGGDRGETGGTGERPVTHSRHCTQQQGHQTNEMSSQPSLTNRSS